MNAAEEFRNILRNRNLVLNRDFEKNYSLLKEEMRKSLIEWCISARDGHVYHVPIVSRRHRDKVMFINKIADMRAILIKLKNSGFTEFHLCEHRQYDEQRRRYGIKSGSRYY